MKRVSLCLVVALAPEAKALINYYGLKQVESKPFALYKRPDDSGICLLISGIGVINMAMSIGWLGAKLRCCNFLNIGIAGHKSLSIGELVRVNSVATLHDRGRKTYPPSTVRWRGLSKAIFTVAEPSSNYKDDVMVDMEASAFFTSAQKFVELERIQSLKIISDNEQHSFKELTPAKAADLIAQHCETISAYATAMQNLVTTPIRASNESDLAAIEHLHCTASQQQQYVTLMQRFDALSVTSPSLSEFATMKQVIGHLNLVLKQQIPAIEC